MNATAANSAQRFPVNYEADLELKRFLVFSLILHIFLALLIALAVYFQTRGEQWSGIGGTDGSVNVKLVGPAAGIPMPSQPTVTESKAVDPTKGLYKEEKPKIPEPKTPAEKIPDFKNEKRKPPTPKSKIDEPKNPPPDNAVDYGNHGSPNLPTSYAPAPGGGSGSPISVNGQAGGNFASRYGWYIEAVRRSVGQNWLQTTIDPAVRAARQAKTVMTFRINRDGSISNVQMSQPSGNLSMDNSARRALDGIRFGPLPNDYSGNSVDVTFDFDLALSH